jgi:ABC-type Co2+ transport system permease subunit
MGLEQKLNKPLSRLHAKLLFVLVAVKLNVALVALVTGVGLAVMVVSGRVVSTAAAPALMVMLLRAGVWPGTVVARLARYWR